MKESMVKFPIQLGFNNDRIVGLIILDSKYLKLFPNNSISPAFQNEKLFAFGLVPTESYILAVKHLKL